MPTSVDKVSTKEMNTVKQGTSPEKDPAFINPLIVVAVMPFASTFEEDPCLLALG